MEANTSKCSVYFGGIDESLKNHICSYLGFSEGSLPMKYLGLPLNAKRLSYLDCSTLIDKISNKFQSWQHQRQLSYAGRLQLIKSTILGIQTYWISNYILPFKAQEKIDKLCSDFLWGHKIHLISWNTICQSKKNGGLGLFSAKAWNFAAATKLLWMIHLKKDWLWIKWIHGNYLQNLNIWQIQSKVNDSWMWKQLLKVRNLVLERFGNEDNLHRFMYDCCTNGKVHLSSVYYALIQSSSLVGWSDTVWKGYQYPKHSFVLWLACHSRLLTMDRLCRMGILESEKNRCVLCSRSQPETTKHLFFECQYAAEILNEVMDWMNFPWKSCDWTQVLNWFSSNLRGKGFLKMMKRMALSVTIYMIWQEMNLRIFQGKAREPSILFRVIKVSIFSKILNESIPVHMKDRIEKM
ncbi:uncharacterized protein LOC109830994 [Asparagus officinalis]|uniref:uncharacterized protein LOC109830994 n=1 Tax=Asparagus officinalis TaxID=4686 RepID=UPI00098E709C|nr:uncharacterized protein LOC109830994 [Asparagus officinalis]